MAGSLPIDSDLTLKRWKPDDPERRPGRHAVRCEGARGLYVRMFESGAITWVFRFKTHDKQRQMSFGPYPAVSLSAARDMARDAYAHVKAGRDPIEVEREAEASDIAERKARKTFADVVEDYMASGRLQALKTDKLRAQRRYVLDTYAVPIIGDMPVDKITDEHVQAVLEPIWREKPATADKVLQYVSGVFTTAIAAKYRKTENPATRRVLAVWIENQGSRDTYHHAAVQVEDAAGWFAAITERDGMDALALRFLALTAARSGMVRGMTWGELRNYESTRIWTVPASRMKSSRRPSDRSERQKPFRVPLSEQAVELLQGVERQQGVDLVFPSPHGKVMGDDDLGTLMRSMHAAEIKAGRVGWLDIDTGRCAVPHGLRSTFRDWVGDKTSFGGELGELSLAHSLGDKTQRAYARGDMIERRREVMQAWADYLTGKAPADTRDDIAAAIELLRATGLSVEDIVERVEGRNVVPIAKGAV